MGKPDSTDCLTLNVTSALWERGAIKNRLLGDAVLGVINMTGHGVYIVHRKNISFLAAGSVSWTKGPLMWSSAECGCYLTEDSFVTIHSNTTYNVQEFATDDQHWEEKERWPSMSTQRRNPGCGASKNLLIVAGGVSGWDEVLASVEVFNIDTRALRRGAAMNQPRALFRLVSVGSTYPRLLAVGGHNGTSILESSEWYEQEENEWNQGPFLQNGRESFSALIISPDLACTEIAPPAHACPTVGGSQNCLFLNATGLRVVNHYYY